MWARLFNMASETDEEKKVPSPDPDAPPAGSIPVGQAIAGDIPLATPVALPVAMPVETTDEVPLAVPVASRADAQLGVVDESADALAEPDAALVPAPLPSELPEALPETGDDASPPTEQPVAEPIAAPAAAAEVSVPQACMACGAERKPGRAYCDDCGYMFPIADAPVAAASAAPARGCPMPTPNARLKDRYEMRELLSESRGISRYRGLDHGHDKPVPVTILWAAFKGSPQPAFTDIAAPAADEEILPDFDELVPVAQALEEDGGIAWEKTLLESSRHPSLPAVVEYFQDNDGEFLIEELPQGVSLWDAWDDPDADAGVRYGWLIQVAEAMDALQKAGGLIEGIRPELVVVSADGRARIADLAELLPLPLPGGAPIKASLYTAPELILTPDQADARAGLYSFGAMIYSLEYLHHPLEEKNFEHQFAPEQITDKFPDVHPLLFRLLNKTFVRDRRSRFPTDEAIKTDPSGFSELIRSLDVCRRNLDKVRLDIASWTTTGMVRTGNEDAFAVLHGSEACMDDLWEYALVLLCDGMGGYEAGEIAAAMAIYEMRKYLLGQPLFASLAGKEPPSGPVDAKGYQDALTAALRHANKEVYTSSRTPGGKGKRGMGCTAECVYVDNQNVIVGHVGDSRTYHLSRGRLVQLTRDQTLVNRLVELGQLTEAEAEDHPRKNELQQAIGGQPEVLPGGYSAKLRRGDWVLVCSDGLTNHIPSADLEKMLTREAAYSAEEAARRLLNLVNLRGATDNATIVVIRAS